MIIEAGRLGMGRKPSNKAELAPDFRAFTAIGEKDLAGAAGTWADFKNTGNAGIGKKLSIKSS